jgi:FixJ family two-component response regulator
MGTALHLPADSLIAIVDDDEESREALTLLTRSLGFAVESYASAAQFLAAPSLQRISCLIADIHMPGMTGVELYRRLATAGHAIPTILITAYPDDTVRARAIADGVIAYLGKPCTDGTLLGCLRAALLSDKPDHHRS